MTEGNGELGKIEVLTRHSTAEIYLHGAHVTNFQKKGEPPLLFTSQFSRFAPNQPIRGGVPIIFPWFGSREGEPAHGFARLADWELIETATLPAGGATLRFSLPDVPEAATWPPFAAYYIVTVTDQLALELVVVNASADQTFTFENCLHTYCAVGDINSVTVLGLKGVSYQDKVDHFTQKTETNDSIRISSEVDRVFLDTASPIEIHDPSLKRIVRIEKSGSQSTVIWNPWVTKSQQIPDFGTDEFRRMLCVETGNVDQNRITLPPGEAAVLKTIVSSRPA
ncbi:MAG TPA: D-hexose-6-phosphate mutarotase [Verrucomicrobiae bacterium]|nr:D-hexose-6-phosphate mutarotase [Verrucomicrobiae bacterium]